MFERYRSCFGHARRVHKIPQTVLALTVSYLCSNESGWYSVFSVLVAGRIYCKYCKHVPMPMDSYAYGFLGSYAHGFLCLWEKILACFNDCLGPTFGTRSHPSPRINFDICSQAFSCKRLSQCGHPRQPAMVGRQLLSDVSYKYIWYTLASTPSPDTQLKVYRVVRWQSGVSSCGGIFRSVRFKVQSGI